MKYKFLLITVPLLALSCQKANGPTNPVGTPNAPTGTISPFAIPSSLPTATTISSSDNPSEAADTDIFEVYEGIEDERCESGYATYVFYGPDLNDNGKLEENEYVKQAFVNCTNKKVKVCHKNITILVEEEGVKAHIEHGDSSGKCEKGSHKEKDEHEINDF